VNGPKKRELSLTHMCLCS